MLNSLYNIKDRHLFLLFIYLLIIGFVFKLRLSPYLTLTMDMNAFRMWSDKLYELGLTRFYDEVWCDYMPGYMYILLLLKKIQIAFPDFSYQILYKLPANLADFVNAIIIYYTVKNYSSMMNAVIASLVYYFNIALMANSTFWGQIESFHFLPVLLSIGLSLRGYFYLPMILVAVSVMIKPQSYVILPLIFLLSVKSEFDNTKGIPYKRLIIKGVISIALVILTIILISIPFTWEKYSSQGVLATALKTLVFIEERFFGSYDQYQYTSVNAFNFWALATGMWESDQDTFGISYQKWGTVLFVVSFMVIAFKFIYTVLLKPVFHNKLSSTASYKINDRNYYLISILCIVLIFFVLYAFVTRAHERHFYSAVALMSLIAIRSYRIMFIYIAISIIYLLNLIYAYLFYYPIRGYNHDIITPYISIIIVIELLILFYLSYIYLTNKIYRE